MKDNFENELRDLMKSFDREPAAGIWPNIRRRLENGSGILRLSLLYPIAAAILLLCIGAPGMFQDATSKSSGIVEHLVLDTFMFVRGGDIFRRKCATCHSADMSSQANGPALAGVTQKRSKEWLYNFTRSSQQMIQEEDSIALQVWKAWKPAIMNNFLYLNNQALDTLYYFIEQADKIGGDTLMQMSVFFSGKMLFKKACGSCHNDNYFKKIRKEESLIARYDKDEFIDFVASPHKESPEQLVLLDHFSSQEYPKSSQVYRQEEISQIYRYLELTVD